MSAHRAHPPPHAPSLVALACAVLAVEGCPHRNEAPRPDASIAAAPDASTRSARGRRRRHGRSRAVAVASNAASNGGGARATNTAGAADPGDPGRATADDLALGASADEDNSGSDNAPRQRPRITETGPMLPEALGRPQGATFDMTGGSGTTPGPMGLEPAQISRGMNPLLGRLSRCADATTDDQGHGPHGRVSVRLRVHSNGLPVAAQVSGGGGPADFVTCVRRVVASARFDSFAGPDVFATWGFDVD